MSELVLVHFCRRNHPARPLRRWVNRLADLARDRRTIPITEQNVSLHGKNILQEVEFAENSVVKKSLPTIADGKRLTEVLKS